MRSVGVISAGVGGAQRVRLSELRLTSRRHQAKGAIEHSLSRDRFAAPYSRAYYRGFIERREFVASDFERTPARVPGDEQRHAGIAAIPCGAVGLGLGVVGLLLERRGDAADSRVAADARGLGVGFQALGEAASSFERSGAYSPRWPDPRVLARHHQRLPASRVRAALAAGPSGRSARMLNAHERTNRGRLRGLRPSIRVVPNVRDHFEDGAGARGPVKA